MYHFCSTPQLCMYDIKSQYKMFKFVVVRTQNVKKFKGYEYFFKALYMRKHEKKNGWTKEREPKKDDLEDAESKEKCVFKLTEEISQK